MTRDNEPCPVCTEPLDLSSLASHLEQSHIGSYRRDHWTCGLCPFQAEDMGSVGSHCLRRGHDVSRMLFHPDEEGAVREALAQLQSALHPKHQDAQPQVPATPASTQAVKFSPQVCVSPASEQTAASPPPIVERQPIDKSPTATLHFTRNDETRDEPDAMLTEDNLEIDALGESKEEALDLSVTTTEEEDMDESVNTSIISENGWAERLEAKNYCTTEMANYSEHNESVNSGSSWKESTYPDDSFHQSASHDGLSDSSRLDDEPSSVREEEESKKPTKKKTGSAKPVKDPKRRGRPRKYADELDGSYSIKQSERTPYVDTPLVWNSLLCGLGANGAATLSQRFEDPPLLSTSLLSPIQIARILDRRLSNAYNVYKIPTVSIGKTTPTFLALREIKEAVYLIRWTEELHRDAVRAAFARDRLGPEDRERNHTYNIHIGRSPEGATDAAATRRLQHPLPAYQLPPEACVLRGRYRSEKIRRELWTLESESYRSPFMLMQASWVGDHEPRPWDLDSDEPDSTTDSTMAPGETSPEELDRLVTWMRSETSKYDKLQPWKAFKTHYEAQDFMQPRFCLKNKGRGPSLVEKGWKATKYHCRFKYVPRGLSLSPCRVTGTLLALPSASLVLTNGAEHTHSQPWTPTQYSAPKKTKKTA